MNARRKNTHNQPTIGALKRRLRAYEAEIFRYREALGGIARMEGADEMTDYDFAEAALKIANDALKP